MLPYLAPEKVNARDLSVLPAMEEAVEGSAKRLAAAAEKGDMAAAAQQFGVMTSGCVACHAHFRGQPGLHAARHEHLSAGAEESLSPYEILQPARCA